MSEDELAKKCWRFPQWLNAFQLNHLTALDYFKHSDFYDPNCVNEIVTMQQIDQEGRKQLTGKEYAVDMGPQPQNPNYMVIHQLKRTKQALQLEKVYFIYGQHGDHFGTVFPMPVLEDLITTKWQTAVYHFKEAFESLEKLRELQKSKKEQGDVKKTEGEFSNNYFEASDDILK